MMKGGGEGEVRDNERQQVDKSWKNVEKKPLYRSEINTLGLGIMYDVITILLASAPLPSLLLSSPPSPHLHWINIRTSQTKHIYILNLIGTGQHENRIYSSFLSLYHTLNSSRHFSTFRRFIFRNSQRRKKKKNTLSLFSLSILPRLWGLKSLRSIL